MDQLHEATAKHRAQTEFKKILVGFDGSEHSEKALLVACSLANKLSSKLIVVNVYFSPAYGPGPDGMLVAADDAQKNLENKAEGLVERAVGFAKSEAVEASGVALNDSSVPDALARYALTSGIDLIVLGTRNLAGFRKLVSGSVSSGVVTQAHCPVLIVR